MMFNVCNRGVAADFLTLAALGNDVYWLCPPEEVLKFCRGLSRRTVLRADYMSNEHRIYIYKEDMADERNVYEDSST